MILSSWSNIRGDVFSADHLSIDVGVGLETTCWWSRRSPIFERREREREKKHLRLISARQELMPIGPVLSLNPDRIVLKRIVFSRHPLKIHKTNAAVRCMSFNPGLFPVSPSPYDIRQCVSRWCELVQTDWIAHPMESTRSHRRIPRYGKRLRRDDVISRRWTFLGTYGHMKCQFYGFVKSQDTIFMNLCKRIYPKWTYRPLTSPEEKKDEQMD